MEDEFDASDDYGPTIRSNIDWRAAIGKPQAAPSSPVQEEEEEEPLFAFWDTLEQVLVAPVRAVAEVGDTVGDLAGQDFGLGDKADEVLPEANSTSGRVAGGLAQFAASMVPATRGLRIAVGAARLAKSRWLKYATAAGGGAVADFAGFDPEDPNLSDYLVEEGIVDSLPTAREEDDSNLTRRTKTAVEGGVLGVVGDGLIAVAGRGLAMRRARARLNTADQATMADVDPAFVSHLQETVEAVGAAADRHETLILAREALLGLQEGDQSFKKAASFLEARESGLEPDINLLDEETRTLLETVDHFADESYPASKALADKAEAARGLSPLAALEGRVPDGSPTDMGRGGIEPELGARLRALLQDEADELSTTSLRSKIAQAEADLEAQLKHWEGARTDRRWDSLPEDMRTGYDDIFELSRKDRTSGWRPNKVYSESDARIQTRLNSQGRSEFLPAPKKKVTPETTSKRALVKGGKIRLDRAQTQGLLAAISSGSVEGVGQAVVEGTNLGRILNSDDGVQEVYREITNIYEGKGLKRKVPFAEMEKATQAELDRLGLAAKDALPEFDRYFDELFPDTKGMSSSTRLLSLRTLELGLANRVKDLGERVMAAGRGAAHRDQAEFLQASESLLRLNESRRFLQADVARATASGRIRISDDALDPNALADIIRQGADPQRLAAKMQAIGWGDASPEELLAVGKWAARKEAFYGIWINGLLSGPLTQSVNTLSNAAVAVYRPTEDLVGAIAIGDFQRAGEAVTAYRDLFGNMRGILHLTAKAFSTGSPQLDRKIMGQVEYKGAAGPLEGVLRTQEKGIGKTLTEGANAVFGLPGRLLITMDEFAKGVNYNVHVRKAARRHLRESQPDLDPKSFEIELDQLARDAQRWEQEGPASGLARKMKLKQIHESGLDEARRNTFTNDLAFEEPGIGGLNKPLGQTLQIAQTRHPFMKVMMPFVRTPTNLFRFAMERTPVLGAATNRNWTMLQKARQAGDKDAAQEIAGKQLMGSMIAATVATWAIEGRITGSAPKDAGMRQVWQNADNQEYSIQIGDSLFQYSRLDPFAMQVGLIVDMVNLSGEIEEEEGLELAMMITTSIVQNLTSKRYLQGLFDVVKAIEYAGSGGVERYMRNLAGTFIPMSSAVNQVNRAAVDPGLKEVRTWIDSVQSRIPGYSSELEPRLNMWGEPILLSPGLSFDDMNPGANGWDPSLQSIITSLTVPSRRKSVVGNTVRNRLAEIRYGLDVKARFGSIRGIELDPKTKNQFIKTFANGPGSAPPLEDALNKMLFSNPRMQPDYEPSDERFTDAAIRGMVSEIVNDYASAAEKVVLRDPANEELLKEAQTAMVTRKARTPAQQQSALDRIAQQFEVNN